MILILQGIYLVCSNIPQNYLFKYTYKTEISEDVTPEMRVACPKVRGLIFVSLCLASVENPLMIE
jgi:hypothetical protein